MNDNTNTHVLFDGEKVIISPDLEQIFLFIGNIDREISSVLGFQKRLEGIRDQYLETINLVAHLVKILKEAKMDFNFILSEKPDTFVEKLKFHIPLRSQMIILFANLETLRVLWTAYELGIDDEDKLRDASENAVKPFISKFCLSKENEWVVSNPSRAGKIGATTLIKLRNSLTHFFSVSNLGVVPIYTEKAKILANKTNGKAQFISSMDLYEIIKGAAILMFKEWTNDCLKDSIKFKRKIYFVNSLVHKYAPIVVPDSDIHV